MPKKAARKPVKKAVANPRPKPAKSGRTAAARKKTSKKKKTGAGKVAVRRQPRTPSLGRPLVTAEEKLFLLFHDDFHARQVFEFLRVGTVGELEQHSPQQIIHVLSAPVRQTVDRIRKHLAEHKRHLRDDLEFALEYQRAKQGKQGKQGK